MDEQKETVLSILIELRDILKSQKPVEVKECVVNDRFTRLNDGWVRDTKTGLEWGLVSSSKMTWVGAKKHCADLGGWLPTVRELESLVDRTKFNPAIDKEAFPDTKTDNDYWTDEEAIGYQGDIWTVSFCCGSVGYCNKDHSLYVRPVRSSQRRWQSVKEFLKRIL